MEVAAFHSHPFDRMRLVSVALFLAFTAARANGLGRLGVTQLPALRTPDFPLPATHSAPSAATAWLTSSVYVSTVTVGLASGAASRQCNVCSAVSGSSTGQP